MSSVGWRQMTGGESVNWREYEDEDEFEGQW